MTSHFAVDRMDPMKSLIVKRLVFASVFFVFGACISKQNSWQRPIPIAEAKEKKVKKKAVKKVTASDKERTIVHSKKIKKLQKRQAMRLSKVEYYKIKKFIGEKEDGLLGIRTSKGLSSSEKKKMKKSEKRETRNKENT